MEDEEAVRHHENSSVSDQNEYVRLVLIICTPIPPTTAPAPVAVYHPSVISNQTYEFYELHS